MAAIVRLKRKKTDEPTDALVLSRKKQKFYDDIPSQKEIYRLAGTFEKPCTDNEQLQNVVLKLKDQPAKNVLPTSKPKLNKKIQIIDVQQSFHNIADDTSSGIDAAIGRAIRIYDAVLNDAEIYPVNGTGFDDVCSNEQKPDSLSSTVKNQDMETDDYVYDIFYLEGDSAGFDHTLFEDMLCLEAFGEDYSLFQEYRDEFIYEDDNDDSNDENNWRNDYPDEQSNSSEADEYKPGDEFGPGEHLSFDRINLASDEDSASDGEDNELYKDFGIASSDFNKYYKSYKKSKAHSHHKVKENDTDSEEYEEYAY